MNTETTEKKSCETQQCRCFCHKVPGILLVLIGVAILLGAFEVISSKLEWIAIGILVILLGLKKMCAGVCKCCDKA
jgi:uncharacterized protein YqgC (DUF456 family)